MTTTPFDSDLLVRYVAGEADAAQRMAVEQWAASAPAHAAELEALRAAWQLTDGVGDGPDVDVDAAWAQVDQRTGGTPVIPLSRPSRRWTTWVASAAAAIALLFVGRLVFGPEEQRFAATDAFTPVRLSDSSNVVLSPGAELEVAMGRERRVALAGQAYFEVQRDPERPFVIDAQGLDVTVLGTAFEVTAIEGSDTVLVRVRHGKVGVQANTLDTLVLVAGEEARWVKRANVLERVEAGPVARWGGRIIQFNNAPLRDVVDEINSVYGSRISLGSEALAGCPLTASFGEEPIADVVRIIAGTFGLEVAQTGPATFVLSGDGC